MADKRRPTYSMFPPPDEPLPPPNSAVQEALRHKKEAEAKRQGRQELEKQQEQERRFRAEQDARHKRENRRLSMDSDTYPLDLTIRDQREGEEEHRKQELLKERQERLRATQDHRAGVVGLPPAEEPPKKKKHHKWNPFKKGGPSDANSLAHLSRFGPGRRAVIYGELPTTSAAAAGRY